MGNPEETGELFELFKKLEHDRKPQDRGRRQEERPEAREQTAEPKGSPQPSAAGGTAPTRQPPVKPGKWMVTIRLQWETLILAALACFAVFAAAFWWGFESGKREEREKSEGMPVLDLKDVGAHSPPAGGAAPSRPELSRTPPGGAVPAASGKSYSLRVMTCEAAGNARAEVEKVVDFLKQQGYKGAFYMTAGRHLVVCVGEYRSAADPELSRIKGEIAKLKYRGQLIFKDCYVAQARGR